MSRGLDEVIRDVAEALPPVPPAQRYKALHTPEEIAAALETGAAWAEVLVSSTPSTPELRMIQNTMHLMLEMAAGVRERGLSLTPPLIVDEMAPWSAACKVCDALGTYMP